LKDKFGSEELVCHNFQRSHITGSGALPT